jgi:ubiquinone/menaquinone biosynthesis C-methylase UbiE
MSRINDPNPVRDSAFLNNRRDVVVDKIVPYLKECDRILDIGCGGGHIAKSLKDANYSVIALDIVNKSSFPDVQPIIYDGHVIPFPDDSFDVAFLLTVLHHIKDPLATLAEAKRVARRIVIMEDLYDGWFQKYMTFAMDSFLNREFFGHPHSNKTKAEWEAAFKEMGLKVVDEKSNDFWRFFTSGTFSLERSD